MKNPENTSAEKTPAQQVVIVKEPPVHHELRDGSAITALVFGIFAMIFSFEPAVSFLFVLPAFVFSLVALEKKQSKALSVTALAFSVIAIIGAIAIGLWS